MKQRERTNGIAERTGCGVGRDRRVREERNRPSMIELYLALVKSAEGCTESGRGQLKVRMVEGVLMSERRPKYEQNYKDCLLYRSFFLWERRGEYMPIRQEHITHNPK